MHRYEALFIALVWAIHLALGAIGVGHPKTVWGEATSVPELTPLGEITAQNLVIATAGGYAYVGQERILRVYDLSAGESPIVVGQAPPLEGEIKRVTLVGNRAYVAAGTAGLYILDLADPTAPTIVGRYQSQTEVLSVAVAGNHAYLAEGASGLRVISLTNPATPVAVGHFSTRGVRARDVAIVGTNAFLVTESVDMRVISVANPARPVQIGSYDSPQDGVAITIVNDIAYLSVTEVGVRVVRVSTPSAPQPIALYGINGRGETVSNIVVNGAFMYVAAPGRGLYIYDTTTGSRAPIATVPHLWGPISVSLSGNRAYTITPGTLRVIDVTTPAAPSMIRTWLTAIPANLASLVLVGNHAYVGSSEGLTTIDVTTPLTPTLARLTPLVDGGTGVGIVDRNERMALYLSYYAMHVVDLDAPTAPVELGRLTSSTVLLGGVMSGTLAYLAAGEGGLKIVDLAVPTTPTLLSTITLNPLASAGDVAVVGTRAYVAYGTEGMWVVDVSNPAQPRALGRFAATGELAYSVLARGTSVYLGSIAGGLRVIDVSNPAQPVSVGQASPSRDVRRMTLVDDYLIAATTSSVTIVDIRTPTAPKEVANMPFDEYVYDIEMQGDLVAITGYGGFFGLFRLTRGAETPTPTTTPSVGPTQTPSAVPSQTPTLTPTPTTPPATPTVTETPTHIPPILTPTPTTTPTMRPSYRLFLPLSAQKYTR